MKKKTCRRTVRTRTGAEVQRMIREGKNVVVQYASPNCPACHETNPHIDAAAGKLCDTDVEVVRVNTDINEDFADQMKVEDLPTVQVFHKGQAVGQTSGADKVEFFVDFIRKALKKRGTK